MNKSNSLPAIYKITNMINGKGYVGQSFDVHLRWNIHIWIVKSILKGKMTKHVCPIHLAMAKYGIENFKFEVLQYFNFTPDESILNFYEIFFIADQNTYYHDGYGYNMTKGGDGFRGHRFSEEAKKKMSKAKAGKFIGIDNPFFGKHHSDETKRKIREKRLGKDYLGADRRAEIWSKLRGENSPTYGMVHSEEYYRKRSFPIMCVETGDFFMSCGIAGKILNIKTGTIYNAITKKRATRNGLNWVFITWKEYDDLREKYPLGHYPPIFIEGVENHKNKYRKTYFPVRCMETGQVFKSSGMAAKFAGAKQGSVIVNAIKRGNRSYGFHWEYISWEEFDRLSLDQASWPSSAPTLESTSLNATRGVVTQTQAVLVACVINYRTQNFL